MNKLFFFNGKQITTGKNHKAYSSLKESWMRNYSYRVKKRFILKCQMAISVFLIYIIFAIVSIKFLYKMIFRCFRLPWISLRVRRLAPPESSRGWTSTRTGGSPGQISYIVQLNNTIKYIVSVKMSQLSCLSFFNFRTEFVKTCLDDQKLIELLTPHAPT